ncbi:1-acyl-sn-glycerol-3-phosphate acyltransferase [Candidatus Woesearchaeota archaeon]|nr:1-acyl-sn-glycerol-3-phosphate acyltransferase [Candidatus Woesearchaeota archaeon]
MYLEKVWSSNGKFDYKIAKNELFSDSGFISELKKFCSSNGISAEDAGAKCRGYFSSISGRYTYNKAFWSAMEYFVRTRIIGDRNNLKYGKKNLMKLADLAKDNLLVILPNHKSVFDFMILPYILATELSLFPAILAAEVFDIFPIGCIFRKTGSYFVRREEKDPLYFIVFKHYIALLLKHHIANLFFIEGGRNKDGGYSEPKLGVLKYIIYGKERSHIREDILFVPVSISYEFIPEHKIVVSEHMSQKRKHILKSLIKYLSFGEKFGNCYLHFGDPIKLSDFFSKSKGDSGMIQNLANKVMNEIKEHIVVTNTSLISYTIIKIGKEILPLDKLRMNIRNNYYLLRKSGRDVKNIDLKNIERHLRLMESKNIITIKDDEIHVPKSSKSALEYYRKNILHFFE